MSSEEQADRMERIFQQKFQEDPIIFRAPGRVNIIGEHTDYNEGYVLPAAIDKNAYLGISRRKDREIHLYSLDFEQDFVSSLDELQPVKEGWPNYILGVVDQYLKKGHVLAGLNIVLAGDVPIGSGLSSSAAVESATAVSLNEVFNLGLEKMELALLGQKAEHDFAGVRCGIMDQFASIFGKKDHVIKLDCRSLQYEYLPVDMEGCSIVLFNTNVKHSLASSEYNTRRLQCEEGVAMIREHVPDVNSLRDVTLEMLENFLIKNEIVFRRCHYVVRENLRLLEAEEMIKKRDLRGLGNLMFQSHQGLSKEYEVSCKELDYLVDVVKDLPGVLGARMMGGGFGGCTINIIRNENLQEVIDRITPAYRQDMNLDLSVYIAQTGDGAARLR